MSFYQFSLPYSTQYHYHQPQPTSTNSYAYLNNVHHHVRSNYKDVSWSDSNYDTQHSYLGYRESYPDSDADLGSHHNHPKALNKVRAEFDMRIGHERLVSDSDLSNLLYIHCIIKETLRLFPTRPHLLPHETSKDCTVQGFRVPRGTMLLVNVYAIQRDPELWDDMIEFRPERFENGEVEGFRSFPFVKRRRKCPGEDMAMRLIGLTLASPVHCFERTRVGEELVDLEEGLGLSMPMAKPLEAF